MDADIRESFERVQAAVGRASYHTTPVLYEEDVDELEAAVRDLGQRLGLIEEAKATAPHVCWGVYDVPLAELEALPTLAQGQTDDLKIESDSERVWLARTGVADGEPWDNRVSVERNFGGAWIVVENWRAQ